MEALLDCVDFALRAALAEIGGVVTAGDLSAEGLELKAWLTDGVVRRPFLARWHVEAGMVCEGERLDILRFQAACARRGFRFRLDHMALCG